MKYAKEERCLGGHVVTCRGRRVQYDGNWSFGQCVECDVVTWPLAIRFVDPGFIAYKLSRLRYTISDLFNR